MPQITTIQLQLRPVCDTHIINYEPRINDTVKHTYNRNTRETNSNRKATKTKEKESEHEFQKPFFRGSFWSFLEILLMLESHRYRLDKPYARKPSPLEDHRHYSRTILCSKIIATRRSSLVLEDNSRLDDQYQSKMVAIARGQFSARVTNEAALSDMSTGSRNNTGKHRCPNLHVTIAIA